MVTQHTRDVLAASGQANPVVAKPSLGRWLKSQLPGGEKAMGLRQLGQAVTSPAMVRDIYKAAVSTVAGGAPVGQALVRPQLAERTIQRIAEPARRVTQQLPAAVGAVAVPQLFPRPDVAERIAKQAADTQWRDIGGMAAAIGTGDPLGTVIKAIPKKAGELAKALGAGSGAEEEPRTSPSMVPQAYYPDPGQSWQEEPGGRYLSARYARQFGTWGQTYAGEGWRAIAGRGGWDSHLHPAYTQTSLRWVDRPAQYRVGARTYMEI